MTIAVIVLALTGDERDLRSDLGTRLALSVSLGATINAAWLFVGLKRGGWYQPARLDASSQDRVRDARAERAAFAAINIDWLGMVGHESRRIAWLAASPARPGSCFGVLPRGAQTARFLAPHEPVGGAGGL